MLTDFVTDTLRRSLRLTHRSLAVCGFVLVAAITTFYFRPDLRHVGEWHLLSWLQDRQVEQTGLATDLDAVDRVTAINPLDLPKQQAVIASFLSKKYHIAPEPISAIVAHAFETGKQIKLDPTLILAVMAIESNFNPYAQSAVGAQGLMQVMTKIHSDKYNNFGGTLAAFDPLSNLRVGAKVLFDCIARANGSIEGGLKRYVGAAGGADEGGYTSKVLEEQQRIKEVVTATLPSPIKLAILSNPYFPQ